MVSMNNLLWVINNRAKSTQFEHDCEDYNQIEDLVTSRIGILDKSVELMRGKRQIDKIQNNLIEIAPKVSNICKFASTSNRLYYMKQLYMYKPVTLSEECEELKQFMTSKEMEGLYNLYKELTGKLLLDTEAVVVFNEDKVGFIVLNPLIILFKQSILNELSKV